MRVIIAGGRDVIVGSERLVALAVADSGYLITEVVSGKCRTGIDPAGERWADRAGVPVKPFPVTDKDWRRLGKKAGPLRNRQMACYGEALVLIWDGMSVGSRSMLDEAMIRKLPVYEVQVEKASGGRWEARRWMRYKPGARTPKQVQGGVIMPGV